MAHDKKLSLYGGAVDILFSEEDHKYLVRDNDDFDPQFKRYPSVTTILDSGINKSKFLVPWALNCAITVFNDKLKPGMVLDEVQLRQLAADMKQARWGIKKTAADIGTVSHDWIESYMRVWIETGAPSAEITLPVNPSAKNCVTAMLKWVKAVQFVPSLAEKIVFSRKYGYIGTMDAQAAMAAIFGRKSVIDWKSSKDLYPEYRFQLAAYLQAITEENGGNPDDYDRWLVRLGKDDDEFDAKKLDPVDYPKDLAAFLGMIPGMLRLKELEKPWKGRTE